MRIRRWLRTRLKASGIQPPRGRASTRAANSLRLRATRLLLVAAIVSVGSTLVFVTSATATPPRTGYGFAYSDDGVIVRDPQYASDPGLGDPLYGLSTSITAFRPKAFRLSVPYNAVEVPAEVDRAKAIINRAKQRGVTEIFVSFRQKAGEFATGWTRPGPQSWRDLIRRFMNVPNGTKPDGTPKTIDNDVTMWSPAAQPNDGTGWLSYSPVAPSTVERVRLLAGYYKELAAELASRGSADKLVSPEFHDVKWDSPSEYHPKCPKPGQKCTRLWNYLQEYYDAGGRFGDYLGWMPYNGVRLQARDGTLDFLEATNTIPLTAAEKNKPVLMTVGWAFGTAYGSSGTEAAAHTDLVQLHAVEWLVNDLAALSPRIARVYYYHGRQPQSQREYDQTGGDRVKWESGLSRRDGSLRPAWYAWCAAANGGAAHPYCTAPRKNGRWYVARSNGEYFDAPALWVGGHGFGSTKQFLADIDGNGQDDAVAFFRPTGCWHIALATAGAFGASSEAACGFGIPGVSDHVNSEHLAQVSESGRAAEPIIFREYTAFGTTRDAHWSRRETQGSESTGWRFGPASQGDPWINGHGLGSTDQFVADVTGDGRGEAIVYTRSTGCWRISGPATSRCAPDPGSSRRLVADVTGDGKADAVMFVDEVNGEPAGRWYVAPSTGTNFGEFVQWADGHGAGSEDQLLGDVNGDGKQDAVVHSNGCWHTAPSLGNGFAPASPWLCEHGQGTTTRLLGDVTGDGKADAVAFTSDNKPPDVTPPTVELDGTLKPVDTRFVERGPASVLVDAADELSGVEHAELRVDGGAAGSTDQACAGVGCSLAHDFVIDTEAYAEGPHQVQVLVRDAAGNTTTVSWTVEIERQAPTLSLTGTLKAAEGQTLQDGATYSLTATSSDSLGMLRSGVRRIEFAIDGDMKDDVEQPCPLGACALLAEFELRPGEHESGPHNVVATVTDYAGNEVSQSFPVSIQGEPEPQCPSTPGPAQENNPLPVTPDEAGARFEASDGFPRATQAASEVTLDGTAHRPALDGSQADRFTATGTVAPGEVDRHAADGATLTVVAGGAPICLAPTTVAAGASPPPPAINGAAALYANTRAATDTIVRSGISGLTAVHQLRSAAAPHELVWDIALQPGQELRKLPDGDVAVVVPAPLGTPPLSGAALPSRPTKAQRQQAITDTALALDVGRDLLTRAQAATGDQIKALVPKPWAQDGQARDVPLSLDPAGTQIRLSVDHDPSHAYPVYTEIGLLSADAVDEIEAARSSSEIADYTDAEADAFDPTSQPPPASPLGGGAPATVASTLASGGEDPLTSSAETSEGLEGYRPPDDDAEVPADASTAMSDALLAQRLSDLGVGLTESDPANLVDPRRAEARFQFYRPFVPWNVVALRGSSNPADRARVRMWEDYYVRARQLGLKLDVVLSRGTDASTAPPVPEYKRAVRLFLQEYPGVVKNLMPWNEPNYKHDPLLRDPIKAARYWIAAEQVCHPQNAAARCGFVVAGDFVGQLKKGEPVVPVGTRRKRYTTAYKDYLDSRGKHPRVWAFHNYGDWEAYALRARCRTCAHITKRFYRLFRSDDYRYRETGGGALRRPRVWLTEAGVPYHLSCQGGLTAGFRRKYCEDLPREGVPDELLFIGNRIQRNATAFMLRKLARDFPAISRLYYLRLRNGHGFDYPDLGRNSGECARNARDPDLFPPGWCPLNDFGLIGSSDDAAKVYPNQVPGASGETAPDQRRMAFCIVRDRHTRIGRLRINHPRRLQVCG